MDVLDGKADADAAYAEAMREVEAARKNVFWISFSQVSSSSSNFNTNYQVLTNNTRQYRGQIMTNVTS